MNPLASGHISEDRLTDMALKLLDAAESDRALTHLRACAECENRFRDLSHEAELLRLRPHRTQRDTAVLPRARRPAVFWAGAAAAAVLLLVVFALARRQAGDALDYWLPVDAESVVFRSAGPAGGDARLSEAIDAYRRRDTSRVVRLLQQRPIPDGYEPLSLVLASALVWERRHAEARGVLDELEIDTLPLPARDRASWILLTALWREKDRAGAETMLRDLASRPGEFSERARLQLEAAR